MASRTYATATRRMSGERTTSSKPTRRSSIDRSVAPARSAPGPSSSARPRRRGGRPAASRPASRTIKRLGPDGPGDRAGRQRPDEAAGDRGRRCTAGTGAWPGGHRTPSPAIVQAIVTPIAPTAYTVSQASGTVAGWPVAISSRSTSRTTRRPDRQAGEQRMRGSRPSAAPYASAARGWWCPSPMNRYGQRRRPRYRLTTRVSTPISPKPRPASRHANRSATRATVRPSPGRTRIARVQLVNERVLHGGTSALMMPSREPPATAGVRNALDRRRRMGDTTGNDPRVHAIRRAPRRSCERGQGDDAPARRERRRGDDREVAQAAGRPCREVRAARRGDHGQGQRRGPVAVRGVAPRDPGRGRRDGPQQRRDRRHRDRRRGATGPGATERPSPSATGRSACCGIRGAGRRRAADGGSRRADARRAAEGRGPRRTRRKRSSGDRARWPPPRPALQPRPPPRRRAAPSPVPIRTRG